MLGFNFFRKKREGKRPKLLCIPKMVARTKLLPKLREVFRGKVSRPKAEVAALINPILSGWLNCFDMNPIEKPDAGNLQVRFKRCWLEAQRNAPASNPTKIINTFVGVKSRYWSIR